MNTKSIIVKLLIMLISLSLSACNPIVHESIYSSSSLSLKGDNEVTVTPSPIDRRDPENLDYDIATFDRVVDGDTLIVIINDTEYRVRMIGIDSPESVHPDESRNTKEGEEASNFTKSLFVEDQQLYLVKDVSNTDRYDRLLRYVWIDIPNDVNETNIEKYMVNAIILFNGYAYAKDYEPDIKYSDIFHSLEKEAEEKKRGIFK